MKKYIIIFAGFALLFGVSFAQNKYLDNAEIPSWATNAIELVQEKNVMTGFGDGTFQPSRNLNRAEALVLIFRTKGIDANLISDNKRSTFSDVPRGSWFEKSVIYSTEKGWIKGFPDGKFHPEKELNKAELSVLLQRVYELELNEDKIPRFSDVQEESWFKEAVLALYANDLIRHDRAFKFFPDSKVSRAEAAWIFSEILQKPRLMGTSKKNNFESTGKKISSRRVAIKRQNLNVNNQGYDIDKSAIYVNVYNKIDSVSMIIGDDWAEIGNIALNNTLDDRVVIDDISFEINFENSVGPARNFELRLSNPIGDYENVKFERNGTAFISGWDKNIEPGKTYSFKVFVKPQDVTGYYPKKGLGTIYLSELNATTIGKYADTGRTNYKKAPIKYNSRNLQKIEFNPVVE